MKVSDFEIDYSSGLFSCCEDHVTNCDDPAKEGMLIICDHCDKEMILAKCDDGKLRWRENR